MKNKVLREGERKKKEKNFDKLNLKNFYLFFIVNFFISFFLFEYGFVRKSLFLFSFLTLSTHLNELDNHHQKEEKFHLNFESSNLNFFKALE